MQDNFDLKKYLRHENRLLNESIGGYVDLKPLNSLNEDDSATFKKGDVVKIKKDATFTDDSDLMNIGGIASQDDLNTIIGKKYTVGNDDTDDIVYIGDPTDNDMSDFLAPQYLELAQMNEFNDFGNMEEAKDKLFYATLDTADFKKIMPYLETNGIKAKIVKAVGPAGGWPLIKYTASEEKLKDMIKTYWIAKGEEEDAEDWYMEIKPVKSKMQELEKPKSIYVTDDSEDEKGFIVPGDEEDFDPETGLTYMDDEEDFVDGYQETENNAKSNFQSAINSLRQMDFSDRDIIDLFKKAFSGK